MSSLDSSCALVSLVSDPFAAIRSSRRFLDHTGQGSMLSYCKGPNLGIAFLGVFASAFCSEKGALTLMEHILRSNAIRRTGLQRAEEEGTGQDRIRHRAGHGTGQGPAERG